MVDLALIWAIIILFGVLMYVIMDGFVLGVGTLYPFFPEKHDRDVMMNTAAPVWDGNETWLVLGGAGLFAAFPLAYSVILHALTMPLIFMLLGLIFRGVAFEFRYKAHERARHWWDKAFILGSVSATFFQGVTLGAFMDGFPVENRMFVGGSFDWVAPFPIFVGLALIVAYALLGCTWLIAKTEGILQQRMRAVARPLILLLFAVIVVISIWTPLEHSAIAERWFSFPNILWFSPVPILVIATTWGLLRSIKRETHAWPFVLTLVLVFLGYTGLGISVWPNIIPPDISIWEASGSQQSQGFTLVGALVIIPIILVYTAWSYYVFRGKVQPGEGYH